MGAAGSEESEEELVLYSSRRSWAFAVLGALVLVVGPVVVAFSRPLGGLGIGALVVGVVATIALLVDQPIRSVFSPTGIDRVCPLVRRHFAWDEVETLERLRRSGGVVARVGRRRVVLCDRSEGHSEHLRLMKVVEANGSNVITRLQAPEIDARPTDLYRRKS